MEKNVPAWTYQQYDADYSLPFPGEGYGGWKKADIPIDPAHTAIVVMHAWDTGSFEETPALWRVCEYIPRSIALMEERFPAFLEKVRASGIRLLHVGSQTEKSLPSIPGYARTAAAVPAADPFAGERIEPDENCRRLQAIHTERVLYGHNAAGVRDAQQYRDFGILPLEDEDMACTSQQLLYLCRRHGVSHLIYTGFAVNACLTMSPCGFIDMTRRGLICSVVRDLTTAVENRESCRTESHKEYGLWAFSLWGGFVFDQADLEAHLLT